MTINSIENSDFLSTPSPRKNREMDGSLRERRKGGGDGVSQGEGGNFQRAAWLYLMCCITSGISFIRLLVMCLYKRCYCIGSVP